MKHHPKSCLSSCIATLLRRLWEFQIALSTLNTARCGMYRTGHSWKGCFRKSVAQWKSARSVRYLRGYVKTNSRRASFIYTSLVIKSVLLSQLEPPMELRTLPQEGIYSTTGSKHDQDSLTRMSSFVDTSGLSSSPRQSLLSRKSPRCGCFVSK